MKVEREADSDAGSVQGKGQFHNAEVREETEGNNPQNYYFHEYGEKNGVPYTKAPMYNNDGFEKHERLSHSEVIARANGGSPEDTSRVGRFVSDDGEEEGSE